MHPNIRQCHETLWNHFFNADANLFYESRFE